jgi:hypothetical protein
MRAQNYYCLRHGSLSWAEESSKSLLKDLRGLMGIGEFRTTALAIGGFMWGEENSEPLH